MEILKKLSSGRYLLTVSAAVAFLYMVFCGKIDPKDAIQIIAMVFVMYFSRDRKGGENV